MRRADSFRGLEGEVSRPLPQLPVVPASLAFPGLEKPHPVSLCAKGKRVYVQISLLRRTPVMLDEG